MTSKTATVCSSSAAEPDERPEAAIAVGISHRDASCRGWPAERLMTLEVEGLTGAGQGRNGYTPRRMAEKALAAVIQEAYVHTARGRRWMRLM